MYSPEKVTTIVTRHEFRVKSPSGAQYHATIRDLMDTIQVAFSELREAKGDPATDYDDALHVYAADDDIVIYFETTDHN